jgi:RNA polymerase sigma-70 factor (ECF subfamily)
VKIDPNPGQVTAQQRTNQEWQAVLSATGPAREVAVGELRACVLRAAQFYFRLHNGQLKDSSSDEIQALAEDAAQEAALAVLARLGSFRGDARFLTWASKFGIHAAAALLRRRQWRDVSLESLPEGWGPPLPGLASEQGWEQPELAAQRVEIWEVLNEVVRDDLTDKQRLGISHVLFNGVQPDEVAERAGISMAAFYKLGHDARRKFQQGLERRGWTKEEILQAFARPA